MLFPDLRPTTCDLRLNNCNIFTRVGRREALNVKREAQEVFLILTVWILMAFSAFVPKITGCRMGTGQNGDKGRFFPADFLPNSRFFFFFSSLTTDYRLLPTASSPPLLFRGQALSKSGQALSKQSQPLCNPGHSLSKSGHSLSPQALLALSWRRIALSSARDDPWTHISAFPLVMPEA